MSGEQRSSRVREAIVIAGRLRLDEELRYKFLPDRKLELPPMESTKSVFSRQPSCQIRVFFPNDRDVSPER
jgi:hypothetical protein